MSPVCLPAHPVLLSWILSLTFPPLCLCFCLFWLNVVFLCHCVQSACRWGFANTPRGAFSSFKMSHERSEVESEQNAQDNMVQMSALIPRDTAAASLYWHPGPFYHQTSARIRLKCSQKTTDNTCTAYYSCFKCEINRDLHRFWYILPLNEQNRDYSRGENVHFLQHDNTEAAFFLWKGLKCKVLRS